MTQRTLQQLVPEARLLIELEPEELGALILQVMIGESSPGKTLNYFEGDLFPQFGGTYPIYLRHQVMTAVREAWAWLEGQGLLVWPDSANGPNGWRIVSRRGAKLASPDDWEAYKIASALPSHLLHPTIEKSTYFNFIRGDYDTAVFQAFKGVEVRVREAAGYGPEKYGAPLMRAAFRADDDSLGPLADPRQEIGERRDRCDLFAGAIAAYKNNHSHRNVGTAAQDAVELLLLASHLMRIVDESVNSNLRQDRT